MTVLGPQADEGNRQPNLEFETLMLVFGVFPLSSAVIVSASTSWNVSFSI